MVFFRAVLCQGLNYLLSWWLRIKCAKTPLADIDEHVLVSGDCIHFPADAFAGITPKVLSERLKELEVEGIVTRHIDLSAFPIRTEYTLTKSGIEIVDVIRQIKSWALKWKITNIPCGNQDCKVCVL